MVDESIIKQQATVFRRAIEQCRSSLRAISLTDFPRGSCGDTADMLGMFLANVINVKTDYVSGWYLNQSHAWLTYMGLIIDITADQFGKSPVIVTTNSDWYDNFSIEIRRLPGIYDAVGSHIADLSHDYKIILSATNAIL
jgi:hypothetical protein